MYRERERKRERKRNSSQGETLSVGDMEGAWGSRLMSVGATWKGLRHNYYSYYYNHVIVVIIIVIINNNSNSKNKYI